MTSADCYSKQRLVGQELGRKPVHRESVGWHSALRAQVAVKRVAGYGGVNKLNRTNLDDASPFRGRGRLSRCR